MEQAKNGSELVNASEATTWIDIAYLEGRRSMHIYVFLVTSRWLLNSPETLKLSPFTFFPIST
jgi:hypothetical protein